MKYSELKERLKRFESSFQLAKENDLIDNNADINNCDVMFVNYDGDEYEVGEILFDVMSESYRLMICEKNDEEEEF